jgi:predicted enzyme related to lactoylglutathione lyase
VLLGAALSLVVGGCAPSAGRVPPVTPETTEINIPGKFVWFDLLTDDLSDARRFYGELFGWTFEPVPGVDNYVVIRAAGRPIAGILEIEPRDDHGTAQWLAYVSVEDVDDAVGEFTARGGALHRGPLDIPGRGRAALVSDAQGGYLALLRSSTGDPPDDGDEPGETEFMWIDYVADDADGAAEFYAEVFGWSHRVADSKGERDYVVFSRAQTPRAGMFENPWPNVRPNWLPYVRIGDARAAADRVAELGGSIIVEPRADLRGGSVAVVLDPSGAGLVLQKYPFR